MPKIKYECGDVVYIRAKMGVIEKKSGYCLINIGETETAWMPVNSEDIIPAGMVEIYRSDE